MNRRSLLALLLLAVSLCASAQTEKRLYSKLGPHFIGSYTAAAKRLVEARPRVIKILDLHSPMVQAMRDYKAAYPKGIVVLRIYTPHRYNINENPEASADHFWNNILMPPISALSPADRQLIDFVEGPNECDTTPCWGSLAGVEWMNRFYLRLISRIQTAGLRPCIGSIPVGNPPGSPGEVEAQLNAFAPALRAAKAAGGAWSYHSYTIEYTTNPGVEFWYSLRYRQFYNYFKRAHPDLLDMKLILTEGGVDQSGSPTGSGWQARGSAQKYQDWLKWFDRQLMRDHYVIGVTLFQMGDPGGWPSFELEPIADWMANYIRNPR